MLRLDNLRPGGALRWLYPPLVSVKDRWVGPCEQVLNVLIVCQRYGPGKPSSRSSIEDWLCPHCFYDCLGRETEYEPMDRSVGVLWIVSGALFLGAVTLLISIETTLNVATRWPREIHMIWDHTRTEREMRVACWSGFPCRMYINSNHRDSWIWVVTYLRQHIVN
jgi:hypothetical protein